MCIRDRHYRTYILYGIRPTLLDHEAGMNLVRAGEAVLGQALIQLHFQVNKVLMVPGCHLAFLYQAHNPCMHCLARCTTERNRVFFWREDVQEQCSTVRYPRLRAGPRLLGTELKSRGLDRLSSVMSITKKSKGEK